MVKHLVPAQIDEYEIIVKGKLEGGYWMQWFEGMSMTTDENGDTVLRGPIADQSALYGLLARLRDMAIPLVSVRKMNNEEVTRSGRRGLNWMLLLIYLLMSGGLSALTVYVTSEGILHTALALGLLFIGLGGITASFTRLSNGLGWRILTGLTWTGGVLTLLIYLTIAGWLHPALLIASLLFVVAGVLFYIVTHRQPLSYQEPTPVEWEPLGRRDVSTSERDHE